MASYRLGLLPSAVQEFQGVPFPFRRQINQRLMGLKRNPRPPDAAVLAGDRYVLPVHGWLVLYTIDDTATRVTIVAVVRESVDE